MTERDVAGDIKALRAITGMGIFPFGDAVGRSGETVRLWEIGYMRPSRASYESLAVLAEKHERPELAERFRSRKAKAYR